MKKIKQIIYNLLRKSEKWTNTDMIYLTKGGAWLTINQVISSIASLTLAIAFANILSRETYGNYKYVVSIINLLMIFSLAGIGQSTTQAISRGFEGSFKKSFKIIFLFGLLGSLSSLLLAIYYCLQNNNLLAISFLIASVFIPSLKSFSIFQAYYQGKKYFKKIAISNIIIKLASTATLLLTIFLTNNFFFLILAFLIPPVIVKIYYYISTIKKCNLNDKEDPSTLNYGKHLSVMGVLKSIAGEADKIFVFHYIGSTELAVYSIALYSVAQLGSFINNIKTLAFPKLSESTIDNIKKTLPRKILSAEFIIIPLVIIYIIIAPILFPIFFPKYPESIIFTQILALTLIAYPRSLLSDALIAKQQTKSLYKIKLLGPAGRLLIYFLGAKFYGLNGLVAAVLISEIYLIILYNYYFKKMK